MRTVFKNYLLYILGLKNNLVKGQMEAWMHTAREHEGKIEKAASW